MCWYFQIISIYLRVDKNDIQIIYILLILI